MTDAPLDQFQAIDAMTAFAPAVVLDTNVVLDWLLFRDSGCAALAEQLQAGRLNWHATASMRSELASVLPRPELLDRSADSDHILSTFDKWARICPELHNTAGSRGKLRCRDPDDQKFIDLAVTVGARWLFSKDRAVLALAPAARAHGIEVLTPARWQQLLAG
jgi:uncharacterized protein